jgi:threonine/homoserine/homoserine lactone efflux protein
MIAIAAAGLATVLQASAILFYAVKVVGAAYLFYLAFQLWRAAPTNENAKHAGSRQSIFSLARQDFLVAVGNPKAIVIFTAFLPQFVEISKPAVPQFAVLGALFLGLEWIAIAA